MASFAPLCFRSTTCHVSPNTGDIRLNEDSVEKIGELSKEPLKLNKRDMGLTKDIYMVSAQSTRARSCLLAQRYASSSSPFPA